MLSIFYHDVGLNSDLKIEISVKVLLNPFDTKYSPKKSSSKSSQLRGKLCSFPNSTESQEPASLPTTLMTDGRILDTLPSLLKNFES